MKQNEHVAAFLETLKTKFVDDSARVSTSEWICEHTTLRKKQFSFKGYEFQRAIVDDWHPSLYVIKCSQVGLALSLDTCLPTPTGWTTIANVKIGDQLFDENGNQCNVTFKSEIFIDHDCYELTFSDGTTIVADANHKWFVNSINAYDTEGNGPVSRSNVFTTEFLYKNFDKRERNQFSIPVADNLKTDTKDLPVDPYFLGLWLGDGSTNSLTLTCTKEDFTEYSFILGQKGFELSPKLDRNGNYAVSVWQGERRAETSLWVRMKSLGLIGTEKFIPSIYQRASFEQRLELLAGLIDTDGSVTKEGRIEFYNTNPTLIRQVKELIISLGLKPYLSSRKPKSSCMKNGHIINSQKEIFKIHFVAYEDLPVAKLHRKKSRQKKRETSRSTEVESRQIIDIRKVNSVPTACIEVDSPNHLFLAGESMIPTHNTEVQIRKYLAFLKRNAGVTGIFTLPSEEMFERISKTRVRPVLDTDDIFNKSDGKQLRSVGIYQIDDSFGYFTGMTESDATSISADILFHDELDLSNQSMIGLYQSRLQNSEFKITQSFSTPKFTGHGVHRGFQNSDQHEYMVRCNSCNHWNVPEFNRDFIILPGLSEDVGLLEIDAEMASEIDFDEAAVVCEKCRTPLDLDDPSSREWVARYPGRINRGYRVTPFSTSRITLPYIIRQLIRMRDLDQIAGFHNTVLGEPYDSSNARLTEDQISACMVTPNRVADEPGKDVFIGIDMGLMCHVVVGTTDHVFLFDTVPADDIVEWVNSALNKWNIIAGAVDRHPYTPTSNQIRDISNGRILPVEYKGTVLANPKKDEFDQITHFQTARTMALDAVANAIRERKVTLSGYGGQERVIKEHLRDQVRIEEPEKEARWEKLTGNDHYFHGLGYFFLARRLANVLHFRSDADHREYVEFLPLESSDPTPKLLNVRSRAKDRGIWI